ncbi:zinc-dependent peptidase [soil metagenome]
MFGFDERRRERLRAEPLRPAWRAIIDREVALARRLSAADRRELEGHTAVLLEEKNWEGAGGLEMTDRIRVTIAAQAALLLLHREIDEPYPRLRSIIVYPSGYVSEERHSLDGGMVVVEGPEHRLGESWPTGALVLAWDEVEADARDPDAESNVVLHEFAHQLDQQDGDADGVPPLGSESAHREWQRVLSEEYLALRRAAKAGERGLLDDYGATNPAEFFAVASEAFFLRSGELRELHRALYDELRAFYRQDPAARG